MPQKSKRKKGSATGSGAKGKASRKPKRRSKASTAR